MAEQPYITENPDVREPQVEETQTQVDAYVSPARPDFVIDDGDKVDVDEVRVSLDEQTGPNDPRAVIIPPEGRGSTELPIHALREPTAEQKLASGDAQEATGVVNGKTVTADEAKADSDKS